MQLFNKYLLVTDCFTGAGSLLLNALQGPHVHWWSELNYVTFASSSSSAWTMMSLYHLPGLPRVTLHSSATLPPHLTRH